MYSNRSHLLEQVPLTVSPFVNLPSATTLSYNYKAMPSALPPSATGVPAAPHPPASASASAQQQQQQLGGSGSTTTTTTTTDPSTPVPSSSQDPLQPKPQYVISQSGHAAHPDDIISSCRDLNAHIERMQSEAQRELREFEERIQARELAEKRRVAPGWLDSEARILQPEKKGSEDEGVVGGGGSGGGLLGEVEMDGTSGGAGGAGGNSMAGEAQGANKAPADTDEGAELDRMFGGMNMK